MVLQPGLNLVSVIIKNKTTVGVLLVVPLASRTSEIKMATNFRFGSSCGPQATASAGRAQEEEKVVEQFGKVKIYVYHQNNLCCLSLKSLGL